MLMRRLLAKTVAAPFGVIQLVSASANFGNLSSEEFSAMEREGERVRRRRGQKKQKQQQQQLLLLWKSRCAADLHLLLSTCRRRRIDSQVPLDRLYLFESCTRVRRLEDSRRDCELRNFDEGKREERRRASRTRKVVTIFLRNVTGDFRQVRVGSMACLPSNGLAWMCNETLQVYIRKNFRQLSRLYLRRSYEDLL